MSRQIAVYNQVKKTQPQQVAIIGLRVPRSFFITSGCGESDNQEHAGSYHIALERAGISKCNIMVYSSVMPKIAQEIEKTPQLLQQLPHGGVMETITAHGRGGNGVRATAGIIYGWLYDESGERQGGLVCEYSGNDTEEKAKDILKKSLVEVHQNGFKNLKLDYINLITESFVPKKKFGSALVSICFTDYEVPILSIT